MATFPRRLRKCSLQETSQLETIILHFLKPSKLSSKRTMLFKYILPTVLASKAVAIPVADVDQDLVLFKRDDILEARDLELADLHGVNMTESKRSLNASS